MYSCSVEKNTNKNAEHEQKYEHESRRACNNPPGLATAPIESIAEGKRMDVF